VPWCHPAAPSCGGGDSATPDQYAETSGYATAVADTRNKSGMSVYESTITAVVKDNSNPPAKYRIDMTVGQAAAQRRCRDGRRQAGDGAALPSTPRASMLPAAPGRIELSKDSVAKDGDENSKKLPLTADREAELLEARVLSYGDAATGQDFKLGEKVLVSGGGASAAWGQE